MKAARTACHSASSSLLLVLVVDDDDDDCGLVDAVSSGGGDMYNTTNDDDDVENDRQGLVVVMARVNFRGMRMCTGNVVVVVVVIPEWVTRGEIVLVVVVGLIKL